MRIAEFLTGALATLLIILVAAEARGQSQLELPTQPQQNTAPIAPPKPSTRSKPGETLVLPQQVPPPPPQAPPPPPPEPIVPEAQTRAPEPAPVPLPEIFRGCWQGVVGELDTIQRLPGARPVGRWVAKTYRLCYRRVGTGPFELTFTDAGIKQSRMITNPQGRLKVLSTDGRSFAEMRALLQFQEYSPGSFSGQTFNVDELTNLSAQIDQGEMRVRANVYGEHGGQPWFRATWHATFIHTPN